MAQFIITPRLGGKGFMWIRKWLIWLKRPDPKGFMPLMPFWGIGDEAADVERLANALRKTDKED